MTSLCQERQWPVLRVLQFNIRAAISGAGGVDVSQIAAEIQAVQPDLVSLNEVDSRTLRTHVDEPAYLAEATGLNVVYGPNLIYDGGRFGNAILTRYPVVESHNLRLPGTFGLEPRGLLTAIVSIDGRRVAFSSTHLTEGSDGRHSRLLQAQAVARALHSMAAPTILAGDLNSDPTDVPERILRRHLLDAQEEGGTGLGETFPRPIPAAGSTTSSTATTSPWCREHTGADLQLQRPPVGVDEAEPCSQSTGADRCSSAINRSTFRSQRSPPRPGAGARSLRGGPRAQAHCAGHQLGKCGSAARGSGAAGRRVELEDDRPTLAALV